MLNVSIKKEKMDNNYQENVAKTPNITAPTRIISLKTTKSRKGKAAKAKSSVDKIKVKTLDEIRREKKKKIKKEAVTDTGEGTEVAGTTSTVKTSSVKPTNVSINVSRVANSARYKNLIRPLSICLMALPNGHHAGQRTFRVNSVSNVNIKQEPVDSSSADSNVPPPAVSGKEASESPGCSTVKVKQEPLDNDIDVNHDNIEIEESGMGGGFSDLNSESSFEQLSSSIDFSDVPRGLAQDDDTMSLFANDDTFEEDTELDRHQSGRHSIGRNTRHPSTERDLRETLQNYSVYEEGEQENIHHVKSGEQQASKITDQIPPKHFQRWKDDNPDARNNFVRGKKKPPRGQGQFGKQQNEDPQKYLEELQRMQLLHDVIKGNTQIKRGVIPQKQHESTLIMNTEMPFKEPAVSTGQGRESGQMGQPPQDISRLKVRPIVPGGRGFFEAIGNDEDMRTSSEILPFNKESRFDPHKKHSPRNEGTDYRNSLKRRSSGEATSPDQGHLHEDNKRPKATNQSKQVYCTTQIHLGNCHHSFCRLKHLSPSELEEYKRTGEINAHHDSNDEQDTLTQAIEMKEQHQPEAVVNDENEENEQLCKGVSAAASQALDAMKIREAWQLIYHLYEIAPTNDPILITLVERVLVLCGEEGVDADIAAQVSSKAFDMIPKVRGEYNRHDFTNLMRCLCQTGQYIRAYEALYEMKALNISPTHDVFMDLINSSQAIPDRAFDLLDEIKSLGLFRSSLCSALICLACKTNMPVFERTWSLFQDMMKNSIKPSKEAFLVLLDLLADNSEGQKLIEALIFYDDSSIVPSAKCNKVVIQQSKDNEDMVSIGFGSVCTVAEVCNPQLDVETWNILLSNCYSDNFNFAMKAQDVQRLMKKFQVPFLSQGYNGLLCSLSEGNLTMAVIEVFKDLVREQVNLNDCNQGITAAVSSLIRAKQVDDLVEMVFILTDNGIMVEEKAYLIILEEMENKKHYEQIHCLFRKCHDAGFAMSITLFRKSILALEKWAENPAASLEVYATMKKAYPIIPDSSSQSSDGEGAVPKSRTKVKPVCKFFLQDRCSFGDNCRFAHFPDTASNHLDAPIKKETSIPERKNPFVLRSNSIPLPEQLTAPLPPPPPPPPFAVTMPIPPPGFGGSGSFILREPGSFPNFPQPALTETFGLPKHLTPPVRSISTPSTVSAPPSGIQEPSCIDMDIEVPSSTTQSAPVFSTNVKEDGFKFPCKTEVDFYKQRILKASEEQNFEELARLYVEMKNESVSVCKEMLSLFYSSFTTFNNIGESLSSFVAIIDIQLDNPDVSDDSSARESLDGEDQRFIGELGVALMQLCKRSSRLDEGYLVLHVLHQYSINYFQYPASFLPNEKVLSSPSIALLAADMCLCLEKDPQYDGAVEVLRGCNYALPLDDGPLSLEEAEKRRDTFEKVTGHYMGIGNYTMVYEFLQQVGDKDVFGMTHLKSIYNELLKNYIHDKKVEDAIGIIRVMESEMISRDTNVLRSLVNCLGSIGRFLQAKDIFKSSCLQGTYPVFPQGDGLWNATIWSSFSKLEIQFYLEQHLQHLNRHVEEHRMSNQMPYEEKHLRPLRIIILEEEPNTLSIGLTVKIGKGMQETIIGILGSDFNPPLSCGVSDVIGEVLVNPRSLRRWFLANPTPANQSSPSESEEVGVHQRNVMASKGQLSVRLNVTRMDHPNPNNEGFLDNKSVMDKIKHTICGHLTRYMRNGVIANKEFKGYARVIAEDYFRRFRDIPGDYNKHERTKVVAFVDKYFEKNSML